MAAGYDGSIRIQTKIDQTGFNTGRKQIESGLIGITKSLKTMAAAAGIAFGIAAIVDFSKASIKAASDLTNAMTGLRSIMEGQGRDFQHAQKFINDYISDGLVPATNAINAYKNLAMRGYDTTQIETVLESLKNSAAFGRQASLTMGEAIQTASEGLKNENSILVDNAGVTKNVSMMWADYAKSIGVGVGSLTKAQKIQAEVTGIMEETRFQMSDAAKVASTYSGQIMQLGFNFNNLKVAVGNALIPIARAVLPSINAMILGFTRLANVFAQVSAAIFGKQGQIASSGTAASKAEADLAKATNKVGAASKKTNKELNNTLANFDEINVLASNAADSAGGMTDALAAADGIDVSGVGSGGELFGDFEISPRIQEFFDKIKNWAAHSESINMLKDAFGRLGDTLKILWDDCEPFRDAASTIFGWAVDSAIRMGVNLIEGALELLAGVIDTVSGLFLWLEGILTGDMKMANEGAVLMFKGLGEIIEGVFVAILGRDAVEAIKTFVSEWASNISAWWTNDVSPWFSQEKWSQLWTDTKQWWTDGWAGIKTGWNASVTDWWKNQVTPWFTKAKWIEVMKGVKDGFAETFRNAVNAAIELFNRLIDWVNSRMVFEWDAIEVAGKEIVPAGKVQLFNIPSIPRLATGAVIPPNAEFMAVLGDQSHGRNLEAPEDLIRQIVREESGSGSGETVIRFEGTMGQLIRVLKPYISKEDNRKGKILIKGAPV